MLQGLVKKTASCQYHKGESLKGIAAFFTGRYDMGRKKTIRLITLNVMFVIFSLASAFTGTMAWFLTNRQVNTSTGDFSIAKCSEDCELISIELVKFDYFKTVYNEGQRDEFTVIDYITPETGSVNRYEYNDEDNSFGYYESATWNPVSIMNTYDPIEMIINGNGLRDLNCNAIYEIEVASNDLDTAYINATISKFLGKEKEDDELFFTTCTNFDIFFESDLAMSTSLYYQWKSSLRNWVITYEEPAEGNDKSTCTNASDLPLSPANGDYYLVANHDTKAYLPSYKENVGPQYYQWNSAQSKWTVSDSEPTPGSDKGEINYIDELPGEPESGDYYLVNSPLTSDEDLYYKLSFLSSAKSSHAHFYGSESNEVDLIRRGEVDFDDNKLKFYINVNYAPGELDEYSKEIYRRNYRAVYDFFFNFTFQNRSGE